MPVTQHTKFNLKNQHTSACAPLVRPSGGNERRDNEIEGKETEGREGIGKGET
jgi:hypothetical protein